MFMQKLPVTELVTGEMVRGRGFLDGLEPAGLVHYELWRDGRILVPRTLAYNGVVNLAKNSLLDAWFNNGSRNVNWYIGLVDAPTYSSFQAGDTIGSHIGWLEFTAYTFGGSGTSRGTWTKGAAAAQQITNSSPVIFDFTGTGSVQGIFVTGDPTKTGTGVQLWSTAAFAAPLPVQVGDQLRVTYTVQL